MKNILSRHFDGEPSKTEDGGWSPRNVLGPITPGFLPGRQNRSQYDNSGGPDCVRTFEFSTGGRTKTRKSPTPPLFSVSSGHSFKTFPDIRGVILVLSLTNPGGLGINVLVSGDLVVLRLIVRTEGGRVYSFVRVTPIPSLRLWVGGPKDSGD